MENNGRQDRLIDEMADMLKNHDAMIAELKDSHKEHDVMIKNLHSLLSAHAEEMRDNRRWLRRHEVSIQTHWKAISNWRK